MLLAAMTKHEGGRYHDGEHFLPWYTGPCLEWLMTLDFEEKWVYEFGIGDSTLWYKNRGAVLMGVDSNLDWVINIGCIIGCWHAHVLNKEVYINLIEVLRDNLFDLVIIDGDYRDECTKNALKHLKPGGYLIIDNWDQSTVCPDWPLTKKLIEGMPIKLYYEPDHWDKWCTAVIQKPL